MSLINHEELKKQLASGEITSLNDITSELKNIRDCNITCLNLNKLFHLII
jgi:hypothetical protein